MTHGTRCPSCAHDDLRMEPAGIEPATSCLQTIPAAARVARSAGFPGEHRPPGSACRPTAPLATRPCVSRVSRSRRHQAGVVLLQRRVALSLVLEDQRPLPHALAAADALGPTLAVCAGSPAALPRC